MVLETPGPDGDPKGRRRFLRSIAAAGVLAGLAAAQGPLRSLGASPESGGLSSPVEPDDWPRRRRLLMADYDQPERLMEERVGRRRGPLAP